MAAAVLTLSSVIERPIIKIDDAEYEIVSPEELPLLTVQRLASWGRKLEKLLKASEELNTTQKKQLADVLNDIVAVIMEPVPDDVRALLSEAQLQSVVEVFTMLSLARKTKLAGAVMLSGALHPDVMRALKMAMDGVSSSPGSNASTAATPKAG